MRKVLDDRKKAKRKKRLLAKAQYAQKRAIADLFPRFVFDPGDAPDEFVRSVRGILRDIAFQHESILPPTTVQCLRLAATHGFGAVYQLGQPEWDERQKHIAFYINAIHPLGEALYEWLPNELHSPFHALDMLPGRPHANEILVLFRTLCRVKTQGGTAYHSPHRPTLLVDDRPRLVAYYRHAAERIFERTVGNPRSFGGSGDAFGYLYNYVQFRPVILPDGGLAFALFNDCNPPFFSQQYVKQVLGDSAEVGTPYYYRVGYCPVVVYDDLVVAKRLLLPGMRGTPEHDLLQKARLPREERLQMAERAGQLTLAELGRTEDFAILKWFHEHGVEQVVRLDGEVTRQT